MNISEVPMTHGITIHRGASYHEDFLIQQSAEDPEDPPVPFDLSDYTASAQIRSRGSLLMAFETPIDADLGQVSTEALTDVTLAIKVAPDAEWDLYLTNSAGLGFYLVQGPVEIDPQVTINA